MAYVGVLTTSSLVGTDASGNLTTSTSGFSPSFAGLTVAGTVNLNATGSGVTAIGTGGSGATNIGNATGNTAVTGSLTASTSLTASSGNITATSGNFVASSGVLNLNHASTLTLATLTSTDAGASQGPVVDLYRNSASPAASDTIGAILFNGQNSTPSKFQYGLINCTINTATASSEASTISIASLRAGASVNYAVMGNNIGQYRGTQTNTVAPAGFIGEVLSTNVASASAITLTSTGVSYNITSVALTGGNWMIFALGAFTGVTTGTIAYVAVNATSATGSGTTGFTTAGIDYSQNNLVSTANGDIFFQSPIQFISVASGGATWYYNAIMAFTVGTVKAYGKIQAVRIG